MGRYYSGDIEGKFWFGVQSSTDADFFGSESYEPNYVCYSFDKDHLPAIRKGLKECRDRLRPYREKIANLFKDENGWSDELLDKYGIPRDMMEWQARLELGNKIHNCVKKHGSCDFDAEV